MAKKTYATPNPKRVRAGRLNQRKRKGITAEGRRRLREAAHRNRPWQHSTGPKTAAGKLRASQNGRFRQTDDISRRELQRKLDEVDELIAGMAKSRQLTLDQE